MNALANALRDMQDYPADYFTHWPSDHRDLLLARADWPNDMADRKRYLARIFEIRNTLAEASQ